MIKKLQLTICPNPDCQKSFEDPIIISDNSKTPALTYYGCPNCLYELDPTSLNVLKKADKPKSENEMQHLEEKTNMNCPKYMGYLFDRPKDSIIPYECLNCAVMGKCILKISQGKQNVGLQ